MKHFFSILSVVGLFTMSGSLLAGEEVTVVITPAGYTESDGGELATFHLPEVDFGTPSEKNVQAVVLDLEEEPVEVSMENGDATLRLVVPMQWPVPPQVEITAHAVVRYTWSGADEAEGEGAVLLPWGWEPFENETIHDVAWEMLFPAKTDEGVAVKMYRVVEIRPVELTREQRSLESAVVQVGNLSLMKTDSTDNLLSAETASELVVQP